jgi:hypothetical protein
MGLLPLIAFWVVVIRLWIIEGPKVPLIFIGLWLAGLFGFPALGWSGYIFLAFEALLAAILLIVEKYKSAF